MKITDKYSSFFLTQLAFLAVFFGCSFIPVSWDKNFNFFIKNIFKKTYFNFSGKNSLLSEKYLVIDCPKIHSKDESNPMDYLSNIIKEIEKLNPKVVIIDSINYENQLFIDTLKNTSLKNRLVIPVTDYQFNLIPEKLENSGFYINQRDNLEVISFVSKENFPSVSAKTAEIFNRTSNHLPITDIKYFFNDKLIKRISCFDFLDTKIQTNLPEGKIVLIKTGLPGPFDKPFLTPVGIMRPETLLFNDIQTYLEKRTFVSLNMVFEKILLILFLIALVLLFYKLWLLKAFFFALLILELQFVGAYFLYVDFGISYNYFSLTFFPSLFLFALTVMEVFKLKKMEKAFEETKQLKKIIILQNQSLLNLKKMSELGRLSSGIYHEISNPLHNILNSLKLIKTGDKLSQESNEILDIALAEILRLQKLSKNLRQFYSPVKTEIKQVNLSEIISFSLKLLKPSFEGKSIDIKTNFIKEPIIIKADPDKLQQVFLNIFLNSIDAVSNTGSINVIIKRHEKEAIVIIKDSGPGILKQIRDELFKAFFTTKGDKGSGLGLYVSFEIINNLGGDIIISDFIEGEGAEFIIKIPVE
ncbi:MAG: Sensor protein [uncultured bacterium]|nr:MAG: Sensor protein [uncultured bacterium]